MFIRMAHWNCKRECWDEARTLFETGAVPIMCGHAGFIGARLLGEPGDTARIAFTMWQDEARYRRFVNSPDLQKITEMFAHMYVNGEPPRARDYVVLASGDNPKS